ncbi:hypothetical protein quinque_013041 [Culex quinquefasciatus]
MTEKVDQPRNNLASYVGSWIPAIRDCIEHKEDGFYCRIESFDCKYVQKLLRPSNFVRHFRNEHTTASIEKGFFRKCYKKARPAQPDSPASAPSLHQRRLIAERAKDFVVRREGSFLCNIDPSSECPYRQTQFRKHIFLHHLVTRHPLKAREHGMSEVKRRHAKPGQKRPLEAKTPVDAGSGIDATVRKHIQLNGQKHQCRISAEFCFYFQTQFNSHNFYRHFYTVHPQEAAEHGISREDYLTLVNGPPQQQQQQQVVMQSDSSTEDLAERATEQSGATVESVDQHVEASDSESGDNSIHQVKQEVYQRMMYARKVKDLVTECIRKEGDITCCAIDDGKNCHFYQVQIHYHNFFRHICRVHTEEARRRGFFTPTIHSTPKRVSKAKEASSKTKKVKQMGRLSDMVNECVRHEGSFTYCQIDKHSQYEKGFFKLRPQIKTEKRKGKLCDMVEECGRHDGNTKRQPVIVDPHKLRLAEKVPNFTVRRKASSGRTRYLCNIQPPSGCAYYEPLLHIGNRYRFVNHFIRKHADAALTNGFEEAEQSTGVLDDPATIPPPTKRNSVRALVDKFVTKEGVGARCHIRPESGCIYSQKVYIPFNFARHFYKKHPSAFEEQGFSFHESMLGKSDNIRNESENAVAAPPPPLEESVVVKEELDIFDSLPVASIKQEVDPLSEVDQRGEAANEGIGIAQEDDGVENDSVSNVDYETTASESGSYGNHSGSILEFIRKEGRAFHCAIENGRDCDYQQTRLIKGSFERHFRSVHREASLRHGFFQEQEAEAFRRQSSSNSNPKSTTELVEECVREEQNVTYCQINRESDCTYSQQNFNAHNFARHFRKVHPGEAEERGFFEAFARCQDKTEAACGGRRSAQHSHRDMVFKNTEVNDEGVHCRIAGYCPYVQKKFLPSNFERHFRRKHPKESVEKGFHKVHDEVLTQIEKRMRAEKFEKLWKECVAKDENGAYCRLVAGCTFFQRSFSKQKFRLHFFQKHNEEATRKGFTEDHGRGGIASEKGLTHDQTETRRNKPLGPFGNSTFQRMVFECTATDEIGTHCRINASENCPFSQNTFNLMDYLRHFRTVHPEEARAKRFFRTAEEFKPRHFVLSSQIMQHVIKTEHKLRCGINPSKPCDFVMEKFSSRDFLRHFCKYHPDEAEENEFLVEVTRSPTMEVDGGSEEESADEPYVAYENPLEQEDVEQQIDTPHEDPSTYCRLCFSVVLPLKPVFTLSDLDDRTLAEQIATCAGIDLNVTAEPFVSICSECVQKLDDIQHFRQRCRTLDNAVRGKLLPSYAPQNDFVKDPSEIEIKDELPSDTDEGEDQTPPEIIVDPSNDHSAPEGSANHTFPCCECGEKFSSAQTMIQHYKEKHTAAKPPVIVRKHFKCTDCDTVLPHRSGLSVHRKRYHNPDAPQKQKVYCTMPNCPQFFMGMLLFRRHLKTFHGLTDPAQLALMSVLKQS